MAGALIAIVVAFAYQRSALGRKLRATREDPLAAQASGIHVHRQRLYAFDLSTPGFSAVHQLGSISTDQVSVELTFTMLAMLVVGGVSSLSGAVLGALLISGLIQSIESRFSTSHGTVWEASLVSIKETFTTTDPENLTVIFSYQHHGTTT